MLEPVAIIEMVDNRYIRDQVAQGDPGAVAS